MTIERCACEEAEHYRKVMLEEAQALEIAVGRWYTTPVIADLLAYRLRAALRDVVPAAETPREHLRPTTSDHCDAMACWCWLGPCSDPDCALHTVEAQTASAMQEAADARRETEEGR
ncbi:hypothetical protein LCGC14_1995990 [marine sediment metagenome]|uniref:Uncharacterized protein n=1 Tax=marine sediment metagenome TaxID=412755 RepID=A0A0F9F4X3_9ZZZZ